MAHKTTKAQKANFRFVYEIELPAEADTNEFLEKLQVLVGKYGGSAGGGMMGGPSPEARYRVLTAIPVERDAPELTEADVVTMTEARELLGIPSKSGLATYVRMKHAPIVIDAREPNPTRANRLLRQGVKNEIRARARRKTA